MKIDLEPMCPCGRRLHYVNNHSRNWVEKQIAELGETIKIVIGSDTYELSRHFVALHGFSMRVIKEFGLKPSSGEKR